MLIINSLRLVQIVFLVGISIRLLLGYFNNGYANDDHLLVSEHILKNNSLPASLDCWQCYHPKLYHYTVAKIWNLFDIQSLRLKAILAQEINVLLGIILIFFFWNIIKKTKYSDNVKLTVFAILALNPRLIAINCQATNDTFIIFFGTILIYLCSKFYAKYSLKYLSFLILFSILAGLSKTSFFIIFIGIFLTMLIKIIILKLSAEKKFVNYLYALIAYLILVGQGLYTLGDFKENKEKYGSFIVYNTPTSELPNFFLKTDAGRPGIQSVVSGYFTFRLIDIILNPKISTGEEPITFHRTSFFSQLYGRANFIYFDNHGFLPSLNPPFKNRKIDSVGRVALLLGLLPTLMLFIGLLFQLRYFKRFFMPNSFLQQFENTRFIYLIFGIGFMLFLISFTAVGRDFSFMKIIYIFPGLITMINPLLIGCNKIHTAIQPKKTIFKMFNIALIILFVAYILPVLHLINSLRLFQT